jgi:hypothetical protein
MVLPRIIALMRYVLTQPFRLHNSAVPPELVLLARGAVLVLLLLGHEPYPIRVPYILALDAIPTELWAWVRDYGLQSGLLLLLFTPWVRIGALLSGGIFLIGLLGCRGCHSMAHTYTAMVLLMVGLSSHAAGTRLVRLQMVVLYAAAGLNKALVVEWWNGGYFETMMFDRYDHTLYQQIAGFLPAGSLSTFMGISVIAMEFLLALWFLRREWYLFGIVLGVFFHTGITITMGSTFGPFYGVLLLSFMVFAGLPQQIRLQLPPGAAASWLRRGLGWLRADHYYRVETGSKGLAIAAEPPLRGLAAFSCLLFTHPLTYYVFIFLFHHRAVRGDRELYIGMMLVLLLPLLIRALRLQLGSLATANSEVPQGYRT